ncbi:MAG: HAD family hydrolase, partial [Candidatus Hodarchaeota archaeon]
ASRHFLDVIDSDNFSSLFLQVARQMFRNPGTKTNIEFFMEQFCARVPLSPEEIFKRFQIFYETEFPLLKGMVAPEPFAADVLQICHKFGYKVIIATNPVFPEIAIRTRLYWAVDPSFEPDFITTGDNMHSTKYLPGYFEEILSHIGLEPAECLMIGNSVEEDIIPAKKVGMRTFLTVPFGTKVTENHEADAAGTLEDLLIQLKEYHKKKR